MSGASARAGKPRGRYLGNVPVTVDRTASGWHSVVARAAKATGLRVEFRDHPQPADGRGPYSPPPEGYGSIYTFDPRLDHGEFHREVERLWASA